MTLTSFLWTMMMAMDKSGTGKRIVHWEFGQSRCLYFVVHFHLLFSFIHCHLFLFLFNAIVRLNLLFSFISMLTDRSDGSMLYSQILPEKAATSTPLWPTNQPNTREKIDCILGAKFRLVTTPKQEN